MNLQIYDNFLPPDLFKPIKETMLGFKFPWYYSDKKVGRPDNADEEQKDKNIFQFAHGFYMNYNWVSPFAETIFPVIHELNPLSIIRIKANLTTKTENRITYSYHKDVSSLVKNKTAVFYINTNNGVTIFSDGREINSVENRLILFDSTVNHTGTSCTDESRRVVINFNFTTSQ